MTAERICVYTALFGNYERLNSQPVARDSDVDWICFTDDRDLINGDWKVVVVEPSFALDPVRSARRVKILPPSEVRSYEVSLWIDNSVILDADPRVMVSHWLDGCDLAFPSHSFRSSVLDEFFVVLDDELDDPSRIIEQLDHYARTRPEALEQRPLWSAIIPRRWSPLVGEAMHVWWEHVLRYSRRDQLSIIHALDAVGLVPRRLEIDNFDSEWHHWPVASERKGAIRTRSADWALRRPLARCLELEREVMRLQDDVCVRRADIDQLRSDLEATRDVATDHERARNEAELRLVHVVDVELPAVTAELERHRGLVHVVDVELPAVTAELERHRELLADVHRHLEMAVADRTRLQLANTDLHQVHEELGRQLAARSAELEAIQGSRSWRAASLVSRSVHGVVDPIRGR